MKHKKFGGFTLIEMLLVMVIISIIVYASIGYIQRRTEQMRVDRTSLQMQQILNAGLAFYVSHGTWPTDMKADLLGTYLPTPNTSDGNMYNPYQRPYKIANNGKLFFVYAATPSQTVGMSRLYALQIVGTLPLSYTSSDAGGAPPANPGNGSTNACSTTGTTSCYAVAAVNIPGQNLNNASAVTYAGIYKHGGCVPVPQCPTGTAMTPQIFVVPVSVSGVNDPTATGGKPNVYPISSFTAYATPGVGATLDNSPPACTGSTANPAQLDCTQSNNGPVASQYWRVCLQVVTERGDVAGTGFGNTAWGQWVSLLAITRCSINAESSGTDFSVFTN